MFREFSQARGRAETRFVQTLRQTRPGAKLMFNSKAHGNFGYAVGAAAAVTAVLWALPVQARVVSSQTMVSNGDSITALVSTTDGCIESSLTVTVGTSVSRTSGQPPTAGGFMFYTRYNE
jgi:hypothetical protein